MSKMFLISSMSNIWKILKGWTTRVPKEKKIEFYQYRQSNLYIRLCWNTRSKQNKLTVANEVKFVLMVGHDFWLILFCQLSHAATCIFRRVKAKVLNPSRSPANVPLCFIFTNWWSSVFFLSPVCRPASTPMPMVKKKQKKKTTYQLN